MIKKISVALFIFFVFMSFSNLFVAKASSDNDVIIDNTNYNIEEENDENLSCVVTYDFNGGTYNALPNYSEVYEKNSLLNKLNESSLFRKNCKFKKFKTTDGYTWNYEEDLITTDITLIAMWDWDETLPIYVKEKKYFEWDVNEYLNNKYYGNKNIYKGYTNSVKSVSGMYPIEMLSPNFTKTEILLALDRVSSNSTYGGCGPIAMMGIMHYLSSTLGYSKIIKNPNNGFQRIDLACDVLKNTPTTEVGLIGNKSTLTLPDDYVNSFNTLMTSYGLGSKISAINHGIWKSKEYNLEKIKESINNGIPVTLYTGLAGKSDLDSHYVTLFGYENWYVEDKDGEIVANPVFMMRMNWGWSTLDSEMAYVDADLLGNSISGIITYQINSYDSSVSIFASDFAEEFINTDTGQGQYFYEPKTTSVLTSSGYTFTTRRLRCSYIENKYLVLSADRINAGTAYLEFDLPNNIKKINFDMGLWSGVEYLTNGGKVSIQLYKQQNDGTYEWEDHIVYDIYSLALSRNKLKNYSVYFPANTSKFRFCVTKENPTSDRNKGRLVLDNIIFYRDNEQN